MLTVGAKDGRGGFFPEGIEGRIHTPEDYDKLAEGVDDWDGKAEATQVRCSCLLCGVGGQAHRCSALLSWAWCGPALHQGAGSCQATCQHPTGRAGIGARLVHAPGCGAKPGVPCSCP